MERLWKVVMGVVALGFLLGLAGVGSAEEGNLSGAASSMAENLIFNSSFEESAVEPTGWKIIDEQGITHTATLDPSNPRFGKRSLKIICTNNPSNGWFSLYPLFITGESACPPTKGKTVEKLLQKGKTFTCSWWYRSSSSDAKIFLQVAWNGWKKVIQSPNYTPSDKWQRASFTFTVPEGVESLIAFRFPIVSAKEGDTFWFDGFRLEEGKECTAPISQTEVEGWLVSSKDSFSDKVEFDFYAISPFKKSECNVEVSLIDTSGKKVLEHKERCEISRGLNKIPISFSSGDIPDGVYRISVRLLDKEGNELDRVPEIKMEKASLSMLKEKMKSVEENLLNLKEKVKEAKAKGVDTSYQDLAIVLSEDFLSYANDDIKAGFFRFADYILEYLLGSLKRGETELIQALKDPSMRKDVPNLKMTSDNMRVYNGAFYSGNQPVFLFGPCAGISAFKNMAKLPRYGLNSFQLVRLYIEGEPVNAPEIPGFFKDSEQVDTQIVRDSLCWMDRCEQNNLAGVVLNGLEYLPRWVLEKYPEVKCGKGWPSYIIDHPEIEKLHQLFWHVFAQTYSGRPGLHSYILANEPLFMVSADNPFALKKFQSYLKEKYKTIQNLNARWNKEYKDFDEVKFSDCFGPQYSKGQNSASWYDWVVFNWSRGTELFSSAKKIIREYDKKSPIHIKIQNVPTIFYAQTINFGGLNREDIAEQGEDKVVGCDGRFWYLPKGDYATVKREGPWEMGFWDQVICYEFLKSIAPDCPIFDSEWHFNLGITGEVPPDKYSPEYIRTAIWESCIHGVGGIHFWLWDRTRAIKGHEHLGDGGILVDPAVTETIGRTCLDLRRLAKFVVEFPRQKSEVRILYSYPSIIHQGDEYLIQIKDAFKASFFHNVPVRFITEKQIISKKWDGCKLLIVPGAEYVTEECFEGVRQFVKNGGTVVLIGEPFKFNEYGDRREKSLGNLSGILRIEKVPSSPIEYSGLVDEWLTAAGIRCPFKITEAQTGKNVFGIEARIAEIDKEPILYVSNWNSKPTNVLIEIDGKRPTFINLVDGKHISNPITMEPLDIYLLKVVK